jgi:ABC-type xylose transport system substrate-binding protein
MRYLKLAAVFLALSVLAVNTSYAAGANKKIKVGVSVATMKEAVYSFMKKAMMDNKDKYDAEIYWVAANNDEMAQVANVEDLLAQGIDVLILHPVNTVAAGSLVEKARKENVPVISMDRLPINANVNCHVTANSFLGRHRPNISRINSTGKGTSSSSRARRETM